MKNHNHNHEDVRLSGPKNDTDHYRPDDFERIHGLLMYLKVAVEDIRSEIRKTKKEYFTVDEFAQIVGRSAYTIRRWISERRIRATRVEGTGAKGRWLIPSDQLDTLINTGFGSSVPASALN